MRADIRLVASVYEGRCDGRFAWIFEDLALRFVEVRLYEDGREVWQGDTSLERAFQVAERWLLFGEYDMEEDADD